MTAMDSTPRRDLAKKRASDRAYYQAHKKKIIAYQVRYAAVPENAARIKLRNLDRAKDPAFREKELLRSRSRTQYNREYARVNAERIREAARRRREADPEKYSAQRKLRYARGRKKSIINSIRHRAAARSLPFDLQVESIEWPEFCPVLGIRLNYGEVINGRNESPSIDRVVPEIGYINSNCRVISMRANRLKSDATLQELILLADYAKECMRSALSA